MSEFSAAIPMGVVIRKQPGVTRWVRWIWRPVAVLPGAGPAEWHELRREGEAVEYHAATCMLELFRGETEAYKVALSTNPPSVWVVMRPSEDADAAFPYFVHAVTASPYIAQDHLDNAEEIVEAMPMPPALIAWVAAFVDRNHVEEKFVKRRRDGTTEGEAEDGRGDARIRQAGDVYLSPAGRKRGEQMH
jgi:hypothetical protein